MSSSQLIRQERELQGGQIIREEKKLSFAEDMIQWHDVENPTQLISDIEGFKISEQNCWILDSSREYLKTKIKNINPLTVIQKTRKHSKNKKTFLSNARKIFCGYR
jgi:hypothetical protein